MRPPFLFLHGKIRVIERLLQIGVATLISLGLFFSFPHTVAEQTYTIEVSAPVVTISTPETIPAVPEILVHVADCESGQGTVGGAKQFNADGSVVHGKVNPQDIGKYQINEYWNGATAEKLGYDIYTERGNTLMALYLYDHAGLQPWEWSKPCWGKYLEE